MQKRLNWNRLGILIGLAIGLGCSPNSPTTSTPEPAPSGPQQAVAGVGKKGQTLRDNTGLSGAITAGPATLLNFEQKAVLELQIPPAVQMFKATEGRYPKSHDEFMEKIVQANRLVLPELPEGMVYHFNTEKGELWVYPEGEVPQ